MVTLSRNTCRRVALDIAGLPFVLSSDAPEVLDAALRRFVTSLGAGDGMPLVVTHVSMAREPLPQREVPQLVIDGKRLEIAGGGFEAHVDLGTGWGELHLEQPGMHLVLENYLRIVTAVLILERGGILLHSSAAIRRGEGFVFFGASGAGKSTTALLSHQRGYPVLSDDQNVLYLSEEGVVLHGVPFRGGQCPVPISPGIAPVRRLLALRQDVRDELDPVALPVGAALLSTQVPLVNWHPALMERVLANCEEIARRAPVEILHFRKDAAFWQIL